jgi:tetratricopeptide (TPR) repeat protein
MRILLFTFLLSGLIAQAQSDTEKLDRLVNEGQYVDAIREADFLLGMNKGKASELVNRKAQLFITIGNFNEAEKILNAQLSNTNLTDFQRAIFQSTAGFMSLNKGDSDKALESLQAAQTLFSKSGKENSVEAAQCLSYLGQLYFASGKFTQAEENQLMALQIKSKIFPANHPEIAAAYTDLGLAYSLTNPDKALEYYEMAQPIYSKIYGAAHAKVAVGSTNIGSMYNKLELYGDAQNNFETALGIWKKLYPNGHPNQALVLMQLGSTYDRLKNTKAAKAYYKQAISQYKKAYSDKHPDLASAYNQLAPLLKADNKFDSVLYYYQQALLANTIVFNQTAVSQNPKAKDFYNGMQLLYTLLYKAQALEEKYLNKTIKQSDLTLSLSCLQVADTLVDVLRQNSRDESDKIALGALASEVYENGVRVAHTLSEVTATKAKYRELAFYFAEKSKAAVLLESIADANAKSFAGIPQELVEQEKSLKADIAFYSQKLAQKPDIQQEAELRKILFELNGRYEAFVRRLEKDYPEYFNLKFNSSIPSVETLQNLLPNGTGIVSYFIADVVPSNKRLYIFTITKSSFKIINRALPDNTDKMVRGFTNSIFYSEPVTFHKAGNVLSELLDPKLPGSITDIVIVPAGRLGTVPFEALPLEESKDVEVFQNSYWVNRYAIGYEFSATLLAQKSKRTAVGNNSIFLCAPIQFAIAKMSDLPGTDSEVTTIAGLFGSNAQVKKAGDATETTVKQSNLSQYKYLHFATHGIVDEESPELSRIFLKESSSDDGNLFSGEIFNLSLNADLVALSACQTGLGKISKGEGVIGLSRALVYAGAKNVMVSYWSVSDESTSQIMTRFYQNVLQSSSPSYRKTLQQVKMNMIAEKKYSAPFYWAPFVLIGF